jgi:hypothetical protein
MMQPIPWSWIWFFCAVLAFAIGFAMRDDIRKLFDTVVTKKKRGSSKKKTDDDPEGPMPPKPDPQTDLTGTCSFEGEDLFMKSARDYKGNVLKPGTTVKCSECNQYVSKEDDGCLPYGFNRGSMGSKVCQVGTYEVPPSKERKSCQSSKDCPDNAPCADGYCETWMIPESKVCPF